MSEFSTDTVDKLRDIILKQADERKRDILADARQETKEWLDGESGKLERELDLIIADADKRAEEMRRRKLMSTERERATESLKLQNRLLSLSLQRLQDKLMQLRDRADYADILCGICVDAAKALGSKKLIFKLSAADAEYGPELEKKLKKAAPKYEFLFDTEPALITGGAVVSTEDGRRRVNSDWRSITEEMADPLAERFLKLL